VEKAIGNFLKIKISNPGTFKQKKNFISNILHG
jgi:dihydroxyacetone kinase-like protein